MKKLGLGSIFVVILTAISFSATDVCALVHHVADCTVCHYGQGASETSLCEDSENLMMVREEIVTPNSGPKPVVFTGAYVRGEAPYDGVCEVCHTDTDYHRNSALGDHTHYAGEACISCHPHKKVYAGKDIFSASDTGLASHDTHMMDQNKGPGSGACTDCHSATSPPVAGQTVLFADGNPLATTTACDGCHSDGGAFNGSQMAKVDWDDGVYESGGEALKQGQENWCISCHDSGLSVCQGVSAPNVELYYTSGHGRPDAELECLVCHDATFPHIDGEPRSYWFNDEDVSPADDNADMYDVVNSGVAYAAGYRLRYVDGKVPMMIPATSYTFDNGVNVTEIKNTAYRRCFNAGCHDSFKIFSEGIGIYTNFTAREPDPPYSYSGGGEHRNLHAYHLTRGIEQWDSDWDVDTDTMPETVWGNDSMTTCPTCHNVHGVAGTEGSTNDTMVRDGSLVGRPGFGFSFVIEDTAAGGYPWVTSEGATASTSVGSIFRNGTGNNEMCFGCHGSGGPSGASFIAENVPVVYSDYHTGPDSQDTLTVAGTPWTPGELVGKYIRNVTDGYTEGGAIISNTANTATSSPLCCPGSGDCTWQDGDLAEIYEYHSYTDYYRPWQDFLAPTVDMIWTYDSHEGKDYSLLSEWEQDTQIDITLANDVVVLSHGGLAGAIASGDIVTGQISGATGVVVGVVTNSQICLDMTSGGFQNGEHIYKTLNVDYVVSTSAAAHVGVMYLDCYDGPHMDRVALAGATTDGLHYRCIRSAADCATPFAGKRETGAYFEWNQNNHLFKLNEDCSRLENIGAKLTFTSDVNSKQVFQVLGDYCYVLGCIAYDSMNDGTGTVNGFYLKGYNTTAANCIAHDVEGDGFILYGLGYFNYFQVCNGLAIDNGGEGFKEINTTGQNYALNCVGMNNGMGDFDAGLSGTCNMSSDGTAPGTDSKTNKDFTGMWIDETSGSEDYHLSETGVADSDFQAGAYPYLVHPPNYVPTHDIDGEARSIWYRGVDEAGPPGHGYDISTISGSVGLVDGVAMNGLPGNPVTRENGSYSANVSHGWSGTVTPSKVGYTFDPPSRQYVNVTSDQLNEDFTPIWTTYTLGGSVGTLDGITIDGLPEYGLKTSGGGFYASTVGHGWSGTVTPIDYGDTYRFEPPSRTYTDVQSDLLNEDYTPILTHQICGHIYTVEGVVLSGLPGDPVTAGSTAYYCGRVDDGWSGTVTPIKEGYTFDPPFMVYDNVTSTLGNQNYTPIPD